MVVYHLAFVELLHLFCVDTSVQDISVDLLIAFSAIGDGTQEGGASSTGAAEDETHFAGLENTRPPEISNSLGKKVSRAGGLYSLVENCFRLGGFLYAKQAGDQHPESEERSDKEVEGRC